MASPNHSKNEHSESRKRHLQKSVEILTRWFLKWSAVFPNHPVTKLQTATYAEALIDLSAEQLEHGCKKAGEEMQQFPKPGHIRHGAADFSAEREDYLGPPQLTYPDVTQAERDEAVKYSEALKLALLAPPKKKALSIAEQKAELKKRGLLA